MIYTLLTFWIQYYTYLCGQNELMNVVLCFVVRQILSFVVTLVGSLLILPFFAPLRYKCATNLNFCLKKKFENTFI